MQSLGQARMMAIENWSGILLLVRAPICAEIIRSKAMLGAGGIHVEKMNLSGPELIGFSSAKTRLILSMTGFATGARGPFGTSVMPFSALASILSRGLLAICIGPTPAWSYGLSAHAV